MDDRGYLTDIRERTRIGKHGGRAEFSEDGARPGKSFQLPPLFP
ncbi:hypothetical protein [Enterocloster alcoholdehydrogenati]